MRGVFSIWVEHPRNFPVFDRRCPEMRKVGISFVFVSVPLAHIFALQIAAWLGRGLFSSAHTDVLKPQRCNE